jgi:DNA-binding MltR family transcriptional regulator
MTEEATSSIPEGTPLVMAVSAPLKLIAKDGRDHWKPSLQDINRSTYDYLKLNRASGFIDGNVAPHMMLVGFDGSLAMPALPEFTKPDVALRIFNRVFLEMLLGGIYTEGVLPADICSGWLFSTGYIRMMGGVSHNTSLHSALRDRSASISDNIVLLDQKTVTIATLQKAITRGRSVLSNCDPLSPEIALGGATHYVAGALAEALTCFWTSIEQVISHIWRLEVEANAQVEAIPSRSGFLKDYRVWTTSARIELLYQKGIVHAETYRRLNQARKSRNEFIHRGSQPEFADATAALNSLFQLLSACASNYKSTSLLNDACTQITARCRVRPRTKEDGRLQPTYWRDIARLPGEPQFKGKFKPFDLNLKPIASFDPAYAAKASRARSDGNRGQQPPVKAGRR